MKNDKARTSKRTPADKRGKNREEAGSPKSNDSEDRMSQRSKDLDPDDSPFVSDSDTDSPTSPRTR